MNEMRSKLPGKSGLMLKTSKLFLLVAFPGFLLAQQPAQDVFCANGNQCWRVLEEGNTRWVRVDTTASILRFSA